MDISQIPKERRQAFLTRLDTNLKKVRAQQLPEGVSQEQMDFILAAVELEFMKSKRPMLWNDALHYVGIAGLKKSTLRLIFRSEEFRARLELRGLWWPERWEEESNEYFVALSPQQLQCIQVVTDPTQNGSLGTRLAKVGVNYAVYRNWLKQPAFGNAIRAISEEMIQDNIGAVHTSVTAKALSGDVQAAKLFYEVTGRHDPMRQQTLDLQRVVGLLLEVVTRHITDVPTLDVITKDFEKAMSGDNISALETLPYNPGVDAETPQDADVVDAEVIVPDGFFEL